MTSATLDSRRGAQVVIDVAHEVRRPARPSVRRSLARWRQPRRLRLATGWPLILLFTAYPLWWVSGLAILGYLLAAIPMAYYLLRLRSIEVPRGFGIWLFFLLWVLAGLVTLWADVPGAMAAEGPGRLLPFGYRLAWYLAGTVFLLYVGNTSERELPARRIERLLALMFLITVAGGYLGWILPGLEFQSLLERALPQSLANNDFVEILIHPAAAQIQDILGYESPRPKAPYSYANDWGANYGLLLPFFVLAWTGPESGWRRRAFPLVAILAIPPIIFSLNRGLWLGIGAMAAYVAVRLAIRGRTLAIAGLALAALFLAVVVVTTPLGVRLEERLANPHSNEGRAELAALTVEAAGKSPIIGFGSTRAVEGNFFSIAGGDSPLCPGCSPPQLGTQGHLWLLIFAHGFVGAALFLGFIYFRFARSLGDPSVEALALTACGVYFAVVLSVYDLLAPPFAIIMIALGLLWRRERAAVTTDWQQPGGRANA